MLPKTEKIVKIAEIQDEKIPSNSSLIEKNFVLYKLIDLNNIAVSTEGVSQHNEKLFYIYILNTKTGRIL